MSIRTKPKYRIGLDTIATHLAHRSDKEDRGIRRGKFGVVTAQLGLLLVVMHLFHIEQDFGLLHLTPLIFVGFIVHALLPMRYRLLFFLLLSLAAICTILGMKQGVGLIFLGLGLIGLCHVPIAFWARGMLLLGVGGALAAVRAGWVETEWDFLPTLVLPILGAMFMFRLIIYLYDLRHEKTPASIWERLGYFFMLPNVCFLLFPVVDYKSFQRTWYDAEPASIYQKGVLWMYRGVVHLLLYRVVYYYLLPAPTEVEALGGVLQWMLTTYLLYLRISGQFHMIIGIMALFGFNLPETHHLYYLASSFNDYWRRINIYWKDFMMKIFYYPSFMWMRRWGMMTALAGATLVVFFGTWFLHAYQWFWLQGVFPVTSTDTIFWAILGGLVIINALMEAKRGRKRIQKSKGWSLRGAVVYALKVTSTFLFLTVLWSFWSSASVGEWWAVVSQAANSPVVAFGGVLLGVALLVGMGVLVQYLTSRGWELSLVGSNPSFVRSGAFVGAGTIALLVLAQPHVQKVLGEQPAGWIASLQESSLNQHDLARLERGYYEGLLAADSYMSALWLVQATQPDEWEDVQQVGLAENTGTLLNHELVPGREEEFRGAPFAVNEWGMRDKDYSLDKLPGTYRMALVGSSYEMGSGVGNDQIFEALVEDSLNSTYARGPSDQYEILNFSVNGYSIVQHAIVTERKVTQFQPDVLLLAAHSAGKRRLLDHMWNITKRNVPISYPELHDIIARAGITPEMEDTEIYRRLEPLVEEITWWGYRHIASVSREHGILPVWLHVPMTDEIESINEEHFVEKMRQVAREEGFVTMSLKGAYEGYTQADLMVAPHDGHPNARGHQLLANRLFQELLDHKRVLQLGLSTAAQAEARVAPVQSESHSYQ